MHLTTCPSKVARRARIGSPSSSSYRVCIVCVMWVCIIEIYNIGTIIHMCTIASMPNERLVVERHPRDHVRVLVPPGKGAWRCAWKARGRLAEGLWNPAEGS